MLHARLPDDLPRAAIYSTVFRLSVTLCGQVLEFMHVPDEVLLGTNTLCTCMGKGTERHCKFPDSSAIEFRALEHPTYA